MWSNSSRVARQEKSVMMGALRSALHTQHSRLILSRGSPRRASITRLQRA